MIIKTMFNIDDRVEIKEISRTGSIINVSYDGCKVSYLVRYFDNGSPISANFYEDEINFVNKEKNDD